MIIHHINISYSRNYDRNRMDDHLIPIFWPHRKITASPSKYVLCHGWKWQINSNVIGWNIGNSTYLHNMVLNLILRK